MCRSLTFFLVIAILSTPAHAEWLYAPIGSAFSDKKKFPFMFWLNPINTPKIVAGTPAIACVGNEIILKYSIDREIKNYDQIDFESLEEITRLLVRIDSNSKRSFKAKYTYKDKIFTVTSVVDIELLDEIKNAKRRIAIANASLIAGIFDESVFSAKGSTKAARNLLKDCQNS
ncbi:hypothetical protein [Pseudovibrio sp. POLY-S9]|uniref:hypothetical protein n=1 Tax=Pseudovibrio sp. POLY-S9 TaxID=1576596 RepID=UPI00070CE9BB|nr:hypothetical protein [Pseudovibrio sp. POLY-S9]